MIIFIFMIEIMTYSLQSYL